MCNSDKSSPFVLKNLSEHFIQRQKDVFDHLNTLKSTLHNNIHEDMETDQPPDIKKSKRSITKQFRGKESIFKRPENPISKNYMRKIPDFKKNPHKWKKYTLADVREEDMSETCNTKTALSFLSELKKRNQESVDETIDEPKKIIFTKKSTVIGTSNDDSTSKPSFRSSKLIMPEYNVGEKVMKEKKHKSVNNTSTSQLRLDHLHDEVLDE